MGWKTLKNFAKDNISIIKKKKKNNYKNSLDLQNICKINFIYMQPQQMNHIHLPSIEKP